MRERYKLWRVHVALFCALIVSSFAAIHVRVPTRRTDITTSLIAFERVISPQDNLSGIYVMSPDGNHVCRMAGGGSGDPAWSPDGKRIAYSDAGIVPLHTIIVMRDWVTGEQKTFGSGMPPVWLPDSQHIAVPNLFNEGGTQLIDVSTGQISKIPFQANLRDAVWSPDGKQIAFAGSADQAHLIFLINSDGTQQHVLIQMSAGQIVRDLAWSPDSQRLAFTVQATYADDRHTQLYVINADGSQQLELAHSPPQSSDSSATWSPDGQYIAFARKTFENDRDIVGIQQLYSIKADGTEERSLSRNTAYSDSQPTWSPSNVAFACP